MFTAFERKHFRLVNKRKQPYLTLRQNVNSIHQLYPITTPTLTIVRQKDKYKIDLLHICSVIKIT